MAHAAARTETMKRTLQCPSSVSQSIMGCFFFGKRRRGGGIKVDLQDVVGSEEVGFLVLMDEICLRRGQ